MTADVKAALAGAQAALDAEDVPAAWRALQPLAQQMNADREVAHAWLTLLRLSPGRPGLVADAKVILGAFADDPDLVTIGCDALIREAERQAPDEPPPEKGAAHTAVAAAQGCLERLGADQRDDPTLMGYLQINLANALRLAHLYDRAELAFGAALKRGPDRGHWWFNFGLLHKAQGKYEAGLEANERALALLGPDKPILWNIAICATALGKGARAVEAYKALGLPCRVAASGMPEAELPPVQVRVATVGPGHAGPDTVPDQAVAFELLWVQPLSPCHGVVQTPTYRQADIDYGDVVLWDAVPVGTGKLDGRTVPRFRVLSVLHKGSEHRFRFVALEREAGALAALEGPVAAGGQLFVHRPPDGGKPPASTHGQPLYGKVVLPEDADLGAFRDAFVADVDGRPLEVVMPGLLEALGETAAAGKAHTMWRGLERTGEKARAAEKAGSGEKAASAPASGRA